MTDTTLAKLAELKTTTTADLKLRWRQLFETEPPPYNRRFLESRLAYRIQELAYGGLNEATVRRLEALGEELDGGNISVRRRSAAMDRPIAGTRLIREWQGVEYCVTVKVDVFEWEGRPYQSLSAIANAITGTRWNGLVFFGLKNQRQKFAGGVSAAKPASGGSRPNSARAAEERHRGSASKERR